MTKDERAARGQAVLAVAGIDAGRYRHAIVVEAQGGPASKPLLFPVDRAGFDQAAAHLLDHAAKAAGRAVAPQECLVGIEFAGSAGFTLAHHLDQRGFPVVNVLAKSVKNRSVETYGRRLKTDGKDAAVVCALVRSGVYSGFPFLDPAYATLRHQTAAQERLTKNIGAAVTRLRHVLHTTFPEFEALVGEIAGKKTPLALLTAYPTARALLAAPKRQVLALLHQTSRGQLGDVFYERLIAAADLSIGLPAADGALEGEVGILVAQLNLYTAQADALDQAIKTSLAAVPEAVYLRTIPGVQTATLAAFLGLVGDVRAYPGAGQVQRVLGMDITTRGSSGTTETTPHLSKAGSGRMRRILYLAAMRLIRTEGLYKAKYDALYARNGRKGKKALVAVARSLLDLMVAIARDRVPFDQARFDRDHAFRSAEFAAAAQVARADADDADETARTTAARSRRQRRKAAALREATQLVADGRTRRKATDPKAAWRRAVQTATADDARARGLAPPAKAKQGAPPKPLPPTARAARRSSTTS